MHYEQKNGRTELKTIEDFGMRYPQYRRLIDEMDKQLQEHYTTASKIINSYIDPWEYELLESWRRAIKSAV